MEKTHLFLLEGLTPEEQDKLWQCAATEMRSYRKGEKIYDRSAFRCALALVLEGKVRVLHGHVVMNDLHPGEVFGAAALFGSTGEYFSQVVANTACRVMFLPQETISLWMQMDSRVAENYIRFLSDRIRFLNRRLSTLTAGQTDGKLWRYLLAHCDKDGVVRLPGGMNELAESLDMGRSSLYRSLDALTAAGRIRRRSRIIELVKTEE